MIRIDDQKITSIILAVYNCKGYLTGGDLHGWVQLTTSPGKGSSKYLWTTTPSLHLFTIILLCFQRVQQISTQTRPPRLDYPGRPPRLDHPD